MQPGGEAVADIGHVHPKVSDPMGFHRDPCRNDVKNPLKREEKEEREEEKGEFQKDAGVPRKRPDGRV